MSLDLAEDVSTLVTAIGLGAARQQAIIWTNTDPVLCRHMVSSCHNVLMQKSTFLYPNFLKFIFQFPSAKPDMDDWAQAYGNICM